MKIEKLRNMKKGILGAVLFLFVNGTVLAQEVVITETELPTVVKKNVVKYFGKKDISSIVKDVEFRKTVYDVYFNDQTEAEFSSTGELKEAKSHKGLPDAVVPEKVQIYVKKHYPNVVVTKWERSSNKQEVELSNGLDLEFDLNGRFLRLDD